MSLFTRFYVQTLLLGGISGILSVFTLYGSYAFENSFGSFLHFLFLLIALLLFVNSYKRTLRFSILSYSLIASYVILSLSFIINTRSHGVVACMLYLLLPFIGIHLTSPTIHTNVMTRYTISLWYYIEQKVIGIFLYLASVFSYVTNSLLPRIQASDSMPMKVHTMVKVFSIFVLVGLPILFIVSLLLSNASDAFSDTFDSLFTISINIQGISSRAMTIFFITFLFITDVMFIARLLDKEETLEKGFGHMSSDSKKSIFYALIITFAFLNLFYILFVIAQLHYDLGNLDEYISTYNIESFSSLAVSRFWELIIVTLINVSLFYAIRGLMSSLKNTSKTIKYIVNAMYIGLLVNTLFLVFSVIQRLYVYVSNYGFTNKRLLAYSFTPVLIIVTILIFWSLYSKHYEKIDQVCMSIVMIFFSVSIMLPTTFIVASINYSMWKQGDISVYDPLYTIPVSSDWYSRFDGGYPGNDINDDDGMLIARRLLRDHREELSYYQIDELEQCS